MEPELSPCTPSKAQLQQQQDIKDIASVKRDAPAMQLADEPDMNSQPQKRVKKSQKKQLKENPFDDLKMNESSPEANGAQAGRSNEKIGESPSKNEWVKPKMTPLTIDVVDFSKINRFYSHKSLQKYIRYLFAKTIPNPMWLSIKRQSQVDRIIFIDFEIENSVFYSLLNEQDQEGKQPQKATLSFLQQYNIPSKKALFREAPYLGDSQDLWAAMFVYDQLAVRNQNKLTFEGHFASEDFQSLPKQLTKQLLQLYETYVLSEDQRKGNLYPVDSLPIYKSYFRMPKPTGQQDINNNRILVIDCEMVMSSRGFELARASIMDFSGKLIYDEFFQPEIEITNYNTQYSGITQQTLKDVTKTVKDLHQDLLSLMDSETILVGHSLQNDLHAMKLTHDRVIDTSVLFQRRNGSKMKLKTLSNLILKRNIQVGSHCSEEDCKATLDVMRHKVELVKSAEQDAVSEYHLLKQMLQVKKKVVIVDREGELQHVKHSKQYLGIHVEEVIHNTPSAVLQTGIARHLGKDICQADLIFGKVRKRQAEQWQEYYKNINTSVQNLYTKSPAKTVFLLNFQVNNSTVIYPQDEATASERKRPFCLIVVKPQ